MKQSYWGILVMMLTLTSITFIWFFQRLTNTDEHNYFLLKETTEAAMVDAIDLGYYVSEGEIRINREIFVESFVRRFADNANLAREYKIEIYDINESPPKVSLKVTSIENTTLSGEIISFDIVNKIDAILETPY
jgi:hypothetical protein